MQPELQQGFDAIERQRTDIQSHALGLSDAQLTWKPDAETWSVGQIVQHLVLSDETVGRAREAWSVGTEATMFRILPRALRRALVLRALRRDSVLPLPSPGVEPDGTMSLAESITRWEASREGMRRILDTLQSDEPRYFHPVLGPLTAGQMLELAQTHVAYHTRQMEALQRGAAFPRD